jgi:hypothetical protein
MDYVNVHSWHSHHDVETLRKNQPVKSIMTLKVTEPGPKHWAFAVCATIFLIVELVFLATGATHSPKDSGASVAMTQPQFVSVYLRVLQSNQLPSSVQSPKDTSTQHNARAQYSQLPFWFFPTNMAGVKEIRIFYGEKGGPLTNSTRIIPPITVALVTLKPCTDYEFCASAAGTEREGERSPVVCFKTPWR